MSLGDRMQQNMVMKADHKESVSPMPLAMGLRGVWLPHNPCTYLGIHEQTVGEEDQSKKPSITLDHHNMKQIIKQLDRSWGIIRKKKRLN